MIKHRILSVLITVFVITGSLNVALMAEEASIYQSAAMRELIDT